MARHVGPQERPTELQEILPATVPASREQPAASGQQQQQQDRPMLSLTLLTVSMVPPVSWGFDIMRVEISQGITRDPRESPGTPRDPQRKVKH